MKKLIKDIKRFFNNIRGFLGGWWHVTASQKDVIFSFYGFNHFNFAKRYADMRKERNGLKHWVLPAGSGAEQLVVFNTKEKKRLQQLNLMSRRVTVNQLLKDAYYFTPDTSKKK